MKESLKERYVNKTDRYLNVNGCVNTSLTICENDFLQHKKNTRENLNKKIKTKQPQSLAFVVRIFYGHLFNLHFKI